MIEFYKENSELCVTQGITRSQKALIKEEQVKKFDRRSSIEIMKKAFHGLRASFLWKQKKYQKRRKICRIKVGNSTKACFSWKTSQRPVKISIYMGPQRKFAAEKLQGFFAACGWKMLLVAPELNWCLFYRLATTFG